MAEAIDHEKERKKDTDIILSSPQSKRVVVAGPGTGKSYLFQEAIKIEREAGKTKFLAITFVGKLCDELADDLAGLAITKTLHGFARNFVKENRPDSWEYYPDITAIIKHDLSLSGFPDAQIGDEQYEQRTEYYKAIGHEDVVHYALAICKENPDKIPVFDMILVDEYQDLNADEAEFIDLLATKNKMLVVGDDDQALYAFKGSYSKFIRQKFDHSNKDFESHILKYCSRCPQVIVDAFHNVIDHSGLNKEDVERIKKEYICYTPDKAEDSLANPSILVMQGVPDGVIASRIRDELSELISTQKIKSVLVIGEAQSCQATLSLTARLLGEYGFKNTVYRESDRDVFNLKPYLVQGYRILAKSKNTVLAWRLILEDSDNTLKDKLISANFDNPRAFIESIPSSLKESSVNNAKILKRILNNSKSNRDTIGKTSMKKLEEALTIQRKEPREILIEQLVHNHAKHLSRPLRNIDITVCSILGSKGLGADVVFLLGFDQGRLPAKAKPTKSELYQMLVALTRTKKRMYLINTTGKQTSSFLKAIGVKNYKIC